MIAPGDSSLRADTKKQHDGVLLFLAGMVVIAFCVFTQHTLRSWWWEWTRPETNYQHGVLAVPCALLVLWYRSRNIVAKPGIVWWLLPLLGGVALYLFANYMILRAVQNIAFLFILGGVLGYLFGGKWFRAAALPAMGVLLLAMPLPGPLLNDTTAGLQGISSAGATALLSLFVGAPASRIGNTITLPNYVMEVAAPCSGLQTLMMSGMLALVLAALSDLSPRRRWIFFLMALPVALGANVFRIVVIGLVGNFGSAEAAHQAHDASGMLGLVACAGLLYFLLRRFGCNHLAGQPLS